MRNRFDRELTALHDLLIEMGTLSQKSIETAKDALLQQDRQLARQVSSNMSGKWTKRKKRWSAAA